jgi:hypothetical protein
MGKGTGRGGENSKDEAQSGGTVLRSAALGKLTYVGKITMDELKKHRTPGDAWLLVKGKVNLHLGCLQMRSLLS